MSGGNYIGQVPASNYNPGRAGHWIHGIALHHTWTTLEGAIAHFLDPNAQVSAHEIVDRDGVPTFMLVPGDTAFADGLYEANLDYYAIEFVQSPTDVGFTPTQYAYGHQRALELGAQFGFVPGPDTLLPHHFWVATSCPGDLDIPRLITGGPAMPEQNITPYKPIPGQVYDNNDRNFYDYTTVGIVNGSIAPIGEQVRWTEAKTVNGKWLLHIEGTTWALWDDCVDDSAQGATDGHPNALAPSDFVTGPPPPPLPPPPSPPPSPLPPIDDDSTYATKADLKILSDRLDKLHQI